MISTHCQSIHRLDAEFDRVIRCTDQVLLGAQIFLCRLDRSVAKQRLDLLQLSTSGSTELGASTA